MNNLPRRRVTTEELLTHLHHRLTEDWVETTTDGPCHWCGQLVNLIDQYGDRRHPLCPPRVEDDGP